MLLELADSGSTKVFIPRAEGGGFNVPISFFDRLNDYEFSGLFTELQEINNFDLNQVIRDRDNRRANMGLDKTKYQVVLSSSTGDWFKQVGNKISDFFKPTKPNNSAIPQIQPDGSITYTIPNNSGSQSGFTQLVQNLAQAFGFYQPPSQPQPQQNGISEILPYAAIGVGGLLLYKALKK